MKVDPKSIRKPAVAGTFYPGNATSLEKAVVQYLESASESIITLKRLFGIISPHAGYVASGPVAAVGYRFLRKHPFSKIVVIAPSHHEYFRGISVFSGKAYQTPMGEIPVDQKICDLLTERGGVVYRSVKGHQTEHAIEVQLPFLQCIFPEFSLIPIVIGSATMNELDEFALILAEVFEKIEFVVVASSDLSHYHPYPEAVKMDKHLISLLEKYDLSALESGYENNSLEACGLAPILTLLKYAKILGKARCKTLDYRNLGDTVGLGDQVVGYLSAAVFEL
ncbi:MAG: AmmeMemoRadiSam system protein B [Candidatus Marinimicrobia bacterium CG08_land_8_20_14_0_20_45_22]|nr:MAG: AmmeMemoRadiSam system protein B [Candidatus Marinimicrobia bacterium CG08_land_8_20_14_0_20_45_22]